MRRITLIALALILAAGAVHAQSAPLANTPVPALDLQRYGGEWHEIAHLPMFFQRKCVARITATYTPRADGSVGVRNACDDKAGKRIASEGVARPVAGKPGQLQVRFAPGWLSWVPFIWADYWVVELDPDYQWAVVGGPDRKYLWVLSRTPTMPRERFGEIKARAAQRGYPVEDLVLPAGTLE